MILAHDTLGRDAPGAPVLVLAPSVGLHRDMWAPQLAAFGAAFRVVNLEHRGHDATAGVPTGPYSIDDLADDALETLEVLGVQRFSWCGLSLGGMVGTAVAARVPARVERLALCCTSAYAPPAENWLNRATTVRAEGIAAVADAVAARWFTQGFASGRPEVVAAAKASLLATPVEGYAGCLEAIATLDLRDRLASITAPTLALGGAEDPALPVDPHSTLLAASIPRARLSVVPDASHIATAQQTGLTTRILLDHLTGGPV